MRRLTLLLCLLVVLLGSAGATWAEQPEPDYITITGIMTGGHPVPLPKERTWFYATAEGGVVGSINGEPFTGTFTFEEWGEGEVNFATFTGSGKNNGIVTIFDGDNNLLVQLEFDGKFDTDRGASESVWGTWKSIHPTLKGQGKYTGNAGFVFSVTFTGKFTD